jgi:hypothetical protein
MMKRVFLNIGEVLVGSGARAMAVNVEQLMV